jgi:hypothetical protein
MNWFWLNIPLCVAIATAVVAPLLVVIAREPLGDRHTDLGLMESKPEERRPEPTLKGRSASSSEPVAVLELVS